MPIAAFTLELKLSGTWTPVAAGQVLSVRGSWESSGDQAGVSFGDDTDATLAAELTLDAYADCVHLTPIRYTTAMDASTARTFVGVITRRDRDLDRMTVEAGGMKTLIGGTKGYSPAFARRPVATKTTATSIENPASGGYAAGLVNWLLWQAGGRPYEQAAAYPTATFYYSCDHALLAPDWSWAAGENAWEECLRLAKDSGGQMYQDASGVVRYAQVMGYGTATATETLDESAYATIAERTDPGQVYATKITCQYVPRRRLGTQRIADDTTPHHVESGETATIVIEPEQPIASLVTASPTQLPADALVVTRLDGTPVSPGAGGYTHTLAVTAARVTITVTNADSQPFTVWRVTLSGDPIVAGEAGSVSSGSGTVERALEQSPYIQSASAAQRIADMTLAFYSAARPIVTVDGCVHQPSRAVGGAINLSCAAWGLSAVRHAILGIDHDDTGMTASYTLANVADLPLATDFYRIGTTYSGSDTKKLGW